MDSFSKTLLNVVTLAGILISAGCGQGTSGVERPVLDSSDTRARTLLQNARASVDLSQFERLAVATGLDQVLDEEGPLTVFMPSDGAFSRAGRHVDTTTVGRDSLRSILEFHMVRGLVGIYPITDSIRVSTLQNRRLTLRTVGGQLTVNGVPVLRSIRSQNGIVHVLRAVLVDIKPDTTRTDSVGTDSSAVNGGATAR